jgi:hypothetical protein
MEIQISNESMLKLRDLSSKMGYNEREIIEKALKLYLEYLDNSMSLNEEMDSWENAGIDDLN